MSKSITEKQKVEDFKLDDLMCLYHCLEIEIQRLTLSCIPETMRFYWNQLNNIQTVIRSFILNKEDEINATIIKQKTCKCK